MSKVEILEMKGHHFLWIDDYLWMWDIEPERKEQKILAEQAFGRVLVVGYGLGLIHQYLAEKNNKVWIDSLATVEKYPDVIQENKRVGRPVFGNIIYKDFYEYHPPLSIRYDTIIGDTVPDILPQHLPQYIKFKQHAETLIKPDGKILFWGSEFFEYLINKEIV